MIFEKNIKAFIAATETRFRAKNHNSSIIISIVIFALGVLASYVVSNSIVVSQRKDSDYALNKQLENEEKFINSKLDVYSGILIATGALFRFDSSVSADDWSSLYTSLKLETRSPEILQIVTRASQYG
jgi:CHASE1-domain containing sensor protein